MHSLQIPTEGITSPAGFGYCRLPRQLLNRGPFKSIGERLHKYLILVTLPSKRDFHLFPTVEDQWIKPFKIKSRPNNSPDESNSSGEDYNRINPVLHCCYYTISSVTFSAFARCFGFAADRNRYRLRTQRHQTEPRGLLTSFRYRRAALLFGR